MRPTDLCEHVGLIVPVLGEPEVADLDARGPMAIEHDVVELEIAVCDAMAVQVFHCVYVLLRMAQRGKKSVRSCAQDSKGAHGEAMDSLCMRACVLAPAWRILTLKKYLASSSVRNKPFRSSDVSHFSVT